MDENKPIFVYREGPKIVPLSILEHLRLERKQEFKVMMEANRVQLRKVVVPRTFKKPV